MSPGLSRSKPLSTKRLPSISGASPRVRQVAPRLVHLVDDHLDPAADPRGELRGADRLRLGHEAVPALLLDRLGHVIGQRVGAGAGDVLVAEAADPVELRRIEPVEQVRELGLGLAGVADDEGRAQHQLGAVGAPAGDLVEGAGAGRRAGHPRSTSGWLCWNGMSR